uniref:T-cell surface glycoprotein CD3 epsilon chain n=1 Tax=Euleptes europaea TaxID=460621 RepID=UPI0025413953|nr:T-cell surface glycoprotein CD3 epsilon chain [Euleptes europaea]
MSNMTSAQWLGPGAKALHQHQEGTESITMHFRITVGTFALLLCLPSPGRGQESNNRITVSISGGNVTLTCPTEKAVWWKKNSPSNQSSPWTIENYRGEQHDGLYHCGSAKNSRSIYLQVKVCPGCVEMDFWLVTGIIVADLLVTLGVLILTFYCSRKRAARFGGGPAAGGPRARPRGQREDRPPPVPNPDYEPIRKGQREVYAGLEPRAF